MAAQNSFIFALPPTYSTSVGPVIPKFFHWSRRTLSDASLKQTAPPSIVLKTFVAWKLNIEASPKDAEETPSRKTPKACAAS